MSPIQGVCKLDGTDRFHRLPASSSASAARVRIVTEADRTRRRIERALHDGTQQRLVTLVLELQAMKDAVRNDRPDLLAQLTELEDGLTATLDELREIAGCVHPAILTHGGLQPALKALARRSPLPVRLEIGPVDRLPESVEVAAYYVVAEAIKNAVKHAHASVVQVAVTVADNALQVWVRDDGAGGADPTRGSGLVGLQDRIEALGGTITLHSPPGAGTLLCVEVPLASAISGVPTARSGVPGRAPGLHSGAGAGDQPPAVKHR